MGELYELFPKLPKNIRQIGERDQVLKLYVEDYVNTYLKQLRPAKGADLRVGLLLGNREIHEDVPYVFVDGALEMETVAKDGEKVVFTEDAWQKGLSGSGKPVSQTNGTGVVFMRESGLQFKSIKLLAGTQPLFYRKKSADVFKQRPGG